MYAILLTAHSFFRWLVLLSLLPAIYKSWQGYRCKLPFTKQDNALRHWSATIAHTQLILGVILYSQSPIIKYYFLGLGDTSGEPLFFGLIHIILMLTAIVVITIGSAKAKRKSVDAEKFHTMLLWYSAALCMIFIAIPWPFSPLSHRPYIRL